jgi:hypothetical protein
MRAGRPLRRLTTRFCCANESMEWRICPITQADWIWWLAAFSASGLGSWRWCGPREDEAWLGDERSETAPSIDLQTPSPLAALNLFAVPSSPREEPFAGSAARIRASSPPREIPPRTDSLTEMKAGPTVESKSGDVPSSERSSEEKSIEPAKHQKSSQCFYTAHGD